ncbi:SUMF1/EgtB/PvdO family nonheme iron enzyme [Streptomyces halstedii]|uniref:SUMF1/EgtB/PvdO family nonheme iron enzyme n=1 Tax=Streptomyces halstedii TaxID=1944 RepID=UPI00381244F4
MSTVVDERLRRLRSELDDHSRIADHLGLDLERPLRSLDDGYPENAVALVGKLTEKLLKELWRHHDIEGDPSTKALNDLVKRCRPHIRSSTVMDALEDIRRLRNRSSHDGYDIRDEDGLLAVRRLVDVLVWFTNTGSAALTGGEPDMAPEVARRCEFLAGLYVTLGYRQAKRFVLSSDTVYQLFCRESGMRFEYVELILSRDADDLSTVLASGDGELLRTRLPKLTRFVVLEDNHDRAPSDALHRLLGMDIRIVPYDGFVDTLVDLETHLGGVSSTAGSTPAGTAAPVSAAVLSTDPRTGESLMTESGDAEELLTRLARGSANVLVTGRPGSGKSTLLRALAVNPTVRRFRFYFDLGLKPKDEPFSEYAARLLAPSMASDRSRAYELFLYLIRSGTALCVLDAVDEGVDEPSPAGFLRLFADLAAVLSAESAVIMSSRVSFLADSPQIRQLLDSGAGRSEQLVEQMYANGVDPARVPHFHLVRLVEPGAEQPATPLERRLTASLDVSPGRPFADLLGKHITHVLADRGRPDLERRLPAFFGQAFLTDRTVFSLLDLHRALGTDAFAEGRLESDACVLGPLLRPVGPDKVAFVHTAYQELLAARYLTEPANRDAAAVVPGGAFLTEQVRAFLAGLPGAQGTDDCVLPPGTYLVGPPERLLLRRVPRPVRFDRYAVTAARYRRFLDALTSDGTSRWDHPDQPAGVTHRPRSEQLSRPDYYTDPRYAGRPAVCVSWWAAFAFAAFEGKRLPTSLEWEAAARGADGRLFPWGDRPDSALVNCADSWVTRPMVTYQAWYRDFAEDAVRRAGAAPVDEHPGNRSPFGVAEMVGNCWEWTSSSLGDPGLAVICGGSYDNPMRAVQTSSKGLYRKGGASRAVGFRCVEDVTDPRGVAV